MKPNFDTHAALVSLINAGFDDKKATQLLETIKDSQTDLATKADIDALAKVTKSELDNMRTATKTDLEQAVEPLKWQIKGLYAMNAIILAWMGWMTAILLEILKNLPK